jgi:hypothetical protein
MLRVIRTIAIRLAAAAEGMNNMDNKSTEPKSFPLIRRLKPVILAAIAVGFISAMPGPARANFGVIPHADCVSFDPFTNQMVVYWGYTNINPFEVTVDNSFNFFDPGPGNRDQPVSFQPGRHDNVFITVSDARFVSVTWILGEFFMTATNDPNVYCTNPTASPQPVISPATITVQAGAAAQVFTIATVSAGPSAAGTLTVDSPDSPSFIPAGLNVSNITNTNGVVTAQISANASLTPGTYTFILEAVNTPLEATATITVNVTAPCQGPMVSALPATEQACPGTQVTLTVSASGSGLSYQWRKNSLPINGATSSTFTIPSAAASDSGSYDVVVTGTCGTATSTATALTVGGPPIITTQPVSQAAQVGGTITFSAAASGTPAPSIQWQISTNGGTAFTDISGATGPSLQVTASAGIDDDLYRAIFVNTCGTVTTQTVSVVVFNQCLQNNTNGDHVQFNRATGEYLFTHCGTGGVTLSGKGAVSTVSGVLTISDQSAGRSVKISYSLNQLTGSATISIETGPGLWSTFVIKDTNPAATCSCQ